MKSGEGGEESALFAGDLLRMYTRYAEGRGWKVEILDATESDLGGYKSVTVAVKAKGVSEPGEAPFALLKFEGGVHRVQRVPVTESQGRVHTSAAGVLVLPEAEQVDVTIDENDLRIDVFRSSGPGGQSVNTTDSAVRITHVPTGIVVSCQNEKSQLQNREQALRILRARLLAAAQEKADAEASQARRSQVRTVDRSERIRTYNYPENRISDHRTGYKSYNLDQVLDGDLQPVLDSCVEADLAARLEALEADGSPAADAPVDAAWPGCARPASPVPSTTPPSCSPTSLGTTRSRLAAGRRRLAASAEAYDALVARRAAREPLQHLTGVAVLPARRARGRAGRLRAPARDRAARRLGDRARPARSTRPVVVDLCTGSGAIAKAVADEVPAARVHAVELDEAAHAWAERNLAEHRRRPPARRHGDGLRGPARPVDVLTCNPPYIPLDAWESVAPEARDHDPHLALFSGDDGLDAHPGAGAPRRRAAPARRSGRRRARRRPGTVARPGVFSATGRWSDVRDHARPGRSSALHDRATGTMSP